MRVARSSYLEELNNIFNNHQHRKGEKERYKHLNAEFQRIARRDKKAFFSDQCKEIEESNRMGKTRNLFKKLEKPRENFMKRWEK